MLPPSSLIWLFNQTPTLSDHRKTPLSTVLSLELFLNSLHTYVIQNYSNPHTVHNSITQYTPHKLRNHTSVLINKYLHNEFILGLIFYSTASPFTKGLLGPFHTIQTLHRPSSHPKPSSIHLSHPQEQLNCMLDFTKKTKKVKTDLV